MNSVKNPSDKLCLGRADRKQFGAWSVRHDLGPDIFPRAALPLSQ